MPSSRLVKVRRSIAANIRTARLKHEWVQEQLAEAADVDVGTLRRIETAATSPSLESLVKISEALGISIGDLFLPAILTKPKRGRPRKQR